MSDAIDSSAMERKLAAVRAAVPRLLKDYARGIAGGIGATASGEYMQDVIYRATWNPAKGAGTLGRGTGRLMRSLAPGGPGAVFEVKPAKNDAITIRFGSSLRYAGVQERGMTIMSKGRMHKYFWAMYYLVRGAQGGGGKAAKALHRATRLGKSSGLGGAADFYKRMALSVKKRGFVTIPPRPFLHPAAEKYFGSEGPANVMREQVIDRIVAIWESP